MFLNIGDKIRYHRTNRGIGLNSFAEKIGVSPGYLSNLETGKTDTVSIKLLEKLNDELNLFPNQKLNIEDRHSTVDIQLNEVITSLISLHREQPEKSRHVLLLIEHALRLIPHT